MIYNFTEMKKRNESMEEELQALKKNYQKPQMSNNQLDKLRKRMEEANMENRRDKRKKKMIQATAAAAAIVGAFLILPNTSASIAHAMEQIPIIGQLVEVVTFRDYTYETDRNMADIEVPEIKLDDQAAEGEVKENLERSTEEINAEIQKITSELIAEFEANLEYEEGYQDVIVQSEILATEEEYFTLKLICYQGAGSGYQWNYYYTIDLNTGERLQLKDIFAEGADYITPISENIKEQMREQMAADENIYYWLEDEIEEWNFKAITDETSFYLNDKGNVVIGFDEGEVAPMYMGTVEFEIPAEALQGIRK
ncbi:RsiV family protein [uncultured Acetatifactor sp.]|uniref:RsiV family protein n=1 Tax=uncultured Acetatifactor sp. TaxID=1671927 RepID=UPI002615616E|nr:RsiV family protein [uncultured Acetatifactor sp.]